MNLYFKQYYDLIKNLDKRIKELEKTHKECLTCKEGCDDCCMNLTAFPVEFFAIKEKMKEDGFDISKVNFDKKASCGFLKNSACQIYKYRPIICRTHGLPILVLNDDLDFPEYQVSYCDKNFLAPQCTGIEFNDENVLDMEDINEILFMINKDFIESNPQKEYTVLDRIELRELLEEK